MNVEAAIIDRQAYIPRGERAWSGVDYRLNEIQDRVADQVQTVFMAVHREEVNAWIQNAGRLLGHDFADTNTLSRATREMRESIGRDLRTRVIDHIKNEVVKAFPSPLKGQPSRGISVRLLEEELTSALHNQHTAAERIANADSYVQEIAALQSFIPESIARLDDLTRELRWKWALGKPQSSFSYTLEEYERLKTELPDRAEAARETILAWDRDELIISSRYQQLEDTGYRHAWDIKSALDSARYAKDSGNWEKVQENIGRAYDQIRFAERDLFERKIDDVLEETTPKIGKTFSEGLSAIESDRYRYVISDGSDRRGWSRRECGLSVWLSNHRDEQAMREEFERKYLPAGYVAGHPQAQTLEELPHYLQWTFGMFENGHVLIWLPVEVDGVRIAAGCSLEAEYRDRDNLPTKMPDTGVWIADRSEIMTQLLREFEKTVDPADPEYYKKLEPIITGFVQKARAITLPQAQEVRDAFLQHHPLSKGYYQEASRQLANLRRQHTAATERLRRVREQIRGMPGWRARELENPAIDEEYELQSEIQRLEDSLAGMPATDTVTAVKKPATRVSPTEAQLQALMQTKGGKVEFVGEAAPKTVTQPPNEQKMRDRVALWVELSKQDTAVLIRSMQQLAKASNDPGQVNIIRAILISRGAAISQQAGIGDQHISEAEGALKKVINQARKSESSEVIVMQLEEMQQAVARVKDLRRLVPKVLQNESVKELLGEDEASSHLFQTNLLAGLEKMEKLPTEDEMTELIEEILDQMTSGF